jgi:hypothetical protein
MPRRAALTFEKLSYIPSFRSGMPRRTRSRQIRKPFGLKEFPDILSGRAISNGIDGGMPMKVAKRVQN